jgi:hypothetical protein
MEMVSGELISELLGDGQNSVAQAMNSDQSTDEFLSELYWSALTREVTTSERESLRAYVDAQPDRRAALQDVVWAVLNSNEFLLRR